MKDIYLKVKRQASPNRNTYWESFLVPFEPGMTVMTALRWIQKSPINARGNKTIPVVWEESYCEESCGDSHCGLCSMIINGQARLACTTVVQTLAQPLTLEPLSKFPVVRDLKVDRSAMSQDLKRVKAWVSIDGTHDVGPGPRQTSQSQAKIEELSQCNLCGCCLEACPQVNARSDFIGPSIISQVRVQNLLPTGPMQATERMEVLMGKGGLADCSNAQNCVKACPMSIPLTESIAEMQKMATVHLFKKMLG